MAVLSNRFTRALRVKYPIVSAPMAFAGGGKLAAAVSRAGGLGLIGGGYGDPGWVKEQFKLAGDENIGIGFISWSLRRSPSVLTDALKQNPVAVMLSFGDPRPYVDEIRDSGALLICQCQNTDHIWDAIDVGADVIIAQGSEAGGHGASRGTLTFVPEAADLIQKYLPESFLLAAGGIADGRGLASAFMLGADGVLVGTRLWASEEALVHKRHHESIVEATGDDTMRTTVADVARQIEWPRGLTARIKQNAFTRRWHGREEELKKNAVVEGQKYRQASTEGDPENGGVWFGEAGGIVNRIEPAEIIVTRMAEEAVSHIKRQSKYLIAEGSDQLLG